MKKTDFKLQFDAKSETWYICKVKDELTKNHKTMGNIVTGYMPENPTDCLCPIRSWVLYTEKLHPDNEYLWQTPVLKLQEGKPWYTLGHIGKNPLGVFMTLVSQKCQLSRTYTNHSIRVTAATVLTHLKFSPSEIMSVTGHKSVQSLTVYQKTKGDQKMEMGDVLFQSMCKEGAISRQKAVNPPPKQLALPPPVADKENAIDVIVPFNPTFEDQEVPEFDLSSILNDITSGGNRQQPTGVVQTTNNNNNNILNNIPRSLFSNCHIGNINFQIQK